MSLGANTNNSAATRQLDANRPLLSPSHYDKLCTIPDDQLQMELQQQQQKMTKLVQGINQYVPVFFFFWFI
jgi:hypothetical protein